MKNLIKAPVFLLLVTGFSTACIAADDTGNCRDQAQQILARLQVEVVGELTTADQAAANRIILDACQAREIEADVQLEQAVQEAREEEKAASNAWFTESADKPGNKRLKRKSH